MYIPIETCQASKIETCRNFTGRIKITVPSKVCRQLGLFTAFLTELKSNWTFEFSLLNNEELKGTPRRETGIPNFRSLSSFRRKRHLSLRFRSISLRSPPRPHASLLLRHPVIFAPRTLAYSA